MKTDSITFFEQRFLRKSNNVEKKNRCAICKQIFVNKNKKEKFIYLTSDFRRIFTRVSVAFRALSHAGLVAPFLLCTLVV